MEEQVRVPLWHQRIRSGTWSRTACCGALYQDEEPWVYHNLRRTDRPQLPWRPDVNYLDWSPPWPATSTKCPYPLRRHSETLPGTICTDLAFLLWDESRKPLPGADVCHARSDVDGHKMNSTAILNSCCCTDGDIRFIKCKLWDCNQLFRS